ncbi:MAG TPA: hypothetical protein VFS56_01495 [Gemmatimonadaceae bacterium]|nr:hypothetical protein [Gemmatimonadaceae bacterium]
MMAELFETRGVRDEPAHWDAMALRVAENAARESGRGAFEWLAQSRAGWIAASLLLAAALFSMTSAGDPARTRGSEWVEMVAPGDDVGKQMAVSETPPAVSSLLVQTRGGT